MWSNLLLGRSPQRQPSLAPGDDDHHEEPMVEDGWGEDDDDVELDDDEEEEEEVVYDNEEEEETFEEPAEEHDNDGDNFYPSTPAVAATLKSPASLSSVGKAWRSFLDTVAPTTPGHDGGYDDSTDGRDEDEHYQDAHQLAVEMDPSTSFPQSDDGISQSETVEDMDMQPTDAAEELAEVPLLVVEDNDDDLRMESESTVPVPSAAGETPAEEGVNHTVMEDQRASSMPAAPLSPTMRTSTTALTSPIRSPEVSADMVAWEAKVQEPLDELLQEIERQESTSMSTNVNNNGADALSSSVPPTTLLPLQTSDIEIDHHLALPSPFHDSVASTPHRAAAPIPVEEPQQQPPKSTTLVTTPEAQSDEPPQPSSLSEPFRDSLDEVLLQIQHQEEAVAAVATTLFTPQQQQPTPPSGHLQTPLLQPAPSSSLRAAEQHVSHHDGHKAHANTPQRDLEEEETTIAFFPRAEDVSTPPPLPKAPSLLQYTLSDVGPDDDDNEEVSDDDDVNHDQAVLAIQQEMQAMEQQRQQAKTALNNNTPEAADQSPPKQTAFLVDHTPTRTSSSSSSRRSHSRSTRPRHYLRRMESPAVAPASDDITEEDTDMDEEDDWDDNQSTTMSLIPQIPWDEPPPTLSITMSMPRPQFRDSEQTLIISNLSKKGVNGATSSTTHLSVAEETEADMLAEQDDDDDDDTAYRDENEDAYGLVVDHTPRIALSGRVSSTANSVAVQAPDLQMDMEADDAMDETVVDDDVFPDDNQTTSHDKKPPSAAVPTVVDHTPDAAPPVIELNEDDDPLEIDQALSIQPLPSDVDTVVLNASHHVAKTDQNIHDDDDDTVVRMETFGPVVDHTPSDPLAAASTNQSIAVNPGTLEEDFREDEAMDETVMGDSIAEEPTEFFTNGGGGNAQDGWGEDLGVEDTKGEDQQSAVVDHTPDAVVPGPDSSAVNDEEDNDTRQALSVRPVPSEGGTVVFQISTHVVKEDQNLHDDDDDTVVRVQTFGPVVDQTPSDPLAAASTNQSIAVNPGTLEEDFQQDEAMDETVIGDSVADYTVSGDLQDEWDDDKAVENAKDSGNQEQPPALAEPVLVDHTPDAVVPSSTASTAVDDEENRTIQVSVRPLPSDGGTVVVNVSTHVTKEDQNIHDDDDDTVVRMQTFGPVVDHTPSEPLAAASTNQSIAVNPGTLEEDFQQDEAMDETVIGDSVADYTVSGDLQDEWDDHKDNDNENISLQEGDEQDKLVGPETGPSGRKLNDPKVIRTDSPTHLVDHTPLELEDTPRVRRPQTDRSVVVLATVENLTRGSAPGTGADIYDEENEEHFMPVVDHTPELSIIAPTIVDSHRSVASLNVFATGLEQDFQEDDAMDETCFGDSTIAGNTFDGATLDGATVDGVTDGWGDDQTFGGGVLEEEEEEEEEEAMVDHTPSEMGSPPLVKLPDPSVAALASIDENDSAAETVVYGPVVDQTPAAPPMAIRSDSVVAQIHDIETVDDETMGGGLTVDVEDEDDGDTIDDELPSALRSQEHNLVDRVPPRPESRFGDASSLAAADPSDVFSEVDDMAQGEDEFGPVVDLTPPTRLSTHRTGACSVSVFAQASVATDDLDEVDEEEEEEEGEESWEQNPVVVGDDAEPNPQSGNDEPADRPVNEQLVDFLPPRDPETVQEASVDEDRDELSEYAVGGAVSLMQPEDPNDFGPVVDLTPYPRSGALSSRMSIASTVTQVTASEISRLEKEDHAEGRSDNDSEKSKVVVDYIPNIQKHPNLDSIATVGNSVFAEEDEEEETDSKFGPVVDQLPTPRASMAASRGGSTVDALGTVSEAGTVDEGDGWGDDLDLDTSVGADSDRTDRISQAPPGRSLFRRTYDNDRNMSVRFDASVRGPEVSPVADETQFFDATPGSAVETVSSSPEVSHFYDPEAVESSVWDFSKERKENGVGIQKAGDSFAEAETPPTTPHHRPMISPRGQRRGPAPFLDLTKKRICELRADSNEYDCPCVKRLLDVTKKKGTLYGSLIAPDGKTFEVDFGRMLEEEMVKRRLLEEEGVALRDLVSNQSPTKPNGARDLEVEEIRRENEDFAKLVQRLEADAAKLRQKNVHLSEELTNTSRLVEDLRKERAKKDSDLESAKLEYETLKSSLDAKKMNISSPTAIDGEGAGAGGLQRNREALLELEIRKLKDELLHVRNSTPAERESTLNAKLQAEINMEQQARANLETEMKELKLALGKAAANAHGNLKDSDSEIRKLRDELSAKDKECRELSVRVIQQESELSEAREKQNSALLEVDESRANEASREEERFHMKREVEDLKKALSKAAESIHERGTEVEVERKKFQDDLSAKVKECRGLAVKAMLKQADLDAALLKVEEREQEIEDLKNDIFQADLRQNSVEEEAESIRASMEQTIASMDAKIKASSEQTRTMEESLKEKEQECRALTVQVAKLTEQSNDDRAKELEQSMGLLESEVLELRKRGDHVSTLAEDVEKLKQEVKSKDEQLTGLREAMSTAEGGMKSLKSELVHACKQLESSKKEVSEMQVQWDADVSEFKLLAESQLEQIASLENEMEELRCMKEDSEKKLTSELGANNFRMLELRSALHNSEGDCEALAIEVSNLEKKLKSMERDSISKKSEIAQLSSTSQLRLEEKELECSRLQKEIAALRESAKAAEEQRAKEARELAKNKNDMEFEKSYLKGSLRELEDEIQRTKTEHQAATKLLEGRNQQLRKDLGESRSDVEKLEQKMSEMQKLNEVDLRQQYDLLDERSRDLRKLESVLQQVEKEKRSLLAELSKKKSLAEETEQLANELISVAKERDLLQSALVESKEAVETLQNHINARGLEQDTVALNRESEIAQLRQEITELRNQLHSGEERKHVLELELIEKQDQNKSISKLLRENEHRISSLQQALESATDDLRREQVSASARVKECEMARRDLSTVQDKLQHADFERQNIHDRFQALQRDFAALRLTSSGHEDLVASITAELRLARSRIESLEKVNAAMTGDLQNLHLQKTKADESLSHAISQSNARSESLTHQFEAEIDRMRGEVERLRSQIMSQNSLADELDRSRTVEAQLVMQRDRLAEENQELLFQLGSLNEQVEFADIKVGAMANELDRLEGAAAQLLTEGVSSVPEQPDDLTKPSLSILAVLKDLKARLETLEFEAGSLETENEQLRSHHVDEEVVKELQERCDRLEAECTAERTAFSDLLEQHRSSQEAAEGIQSRIAELESECSRRQVVIETKEGEIAAAEARLSQILNDDTNGTNINFIGKVAALESEVRTTRRRIGKLEDERKSLDSRLKEMEGEAKESQTHVSQEVSNLQEQVESLTEALHSTRERLASKEQEMQKLASERHLSTDDSSEPRLMQGISEDAEVKELRSHVFSLAKALERSESRRAEAMDCLRAERQTNAESLRKLGDSVKRFYSGMGS